MTGESTVHIWTSIVAVALCAVTGDVLTARAMRLVGVPGAIRAVVSEPYFVCGIIAMTFSFYALLYALAPPAPVSLIAPATASLTFVGNAVVARTFLHENVDRRRWFAVFLVVVGIFLIAH